MEGVTVACFMKIFYRSERIGKDGHPFSLYKIRTLKPTRKSFAEPEEYTWCGRFLRRTKLDELVQVVNWIRGDITLVGPRPDFQESWEITPKHIKDKILSVKPGMTSLASIMFHDEERLLQGVEDKYKNYYTIIRPMKLHLDAFYVEHRCILLKIAIIYITLKIVVKSFFRK